MIPWFASTGEPARVSESLAVWLLEGSLQPRDISNLYPCVQGGACALSHSQQHSLLFCYSDEVSRSWQVAPHWSTFPLIYSCQLLSSGILVMTPSIRPPFSTMGLSGEELTGGQDCPNFVTATWKKIISLISDQWIQNGKNGNYTHLTSLLFTPAATTTK